MNRPETIPPAKLPMSAPSWTKQMRFICKWDWLPRADTSCADRVTPSQGASSSPFTKCPAPLAVFLLVTKQVQKGRGIRQTLPLFLYSSSLHLALRCSLALGGRGSASLWHCLPRPSRQSLMGWEWLTSKCLISLHSPHLDGSEEARVLVCLVFRWSFISGGRIRGSHRSTAQPWGFRHIGHGFYPALLGFPLCSGRLANRLKEG